MIEYVANPFDLSEKNLMTFGKVFKEAEYRIVTTVPSSHIKLEGIDDEFMETSTFAEILDDPDTFMSYFSIEYYANGKQLNFPIGVYGASVKYKVRYPLFINGFWRLFLMLGKEEFFAVSEIQNNQENQVYYENLLMHRRRFISNIFRYYSNIDNSFSSVMGWAKRTNRKSITRLCAESSGFFRKEYGSNEYYSSTIWNFEFWNYIRACSGRWDGIKIDRSKTVERKPFSKIDALLKGIVGYNL